MTDYERAYFERGMFAAYAWMITNKRGDQLSDAVVDHAWDHRDEGMRPTECLPTRLSSFSEIVKDAGEDERLVYLEAEARRFANYYPEASDGRNTFVIFADKIADISASNAA